jgi:hypothetical protein
MSHPDANATYASRATSFVYYITDNINGARWHLRPNEILSLDAQIRHAEGTTQSARQELANLNGKQIESCDLLLC